jgi:hypothetical protein
MILDTNLTFSRAVAITTSKASTILDGQSVKNIAKGQPLYLNIYVDTAFTSTVANQLSVQIISSSGADPGASDTFCTVIAARSSSVLQSTGCIWRAAWPMGVPYERIGLYYLATTALAAGYVSAFLTLGEGEDPVVLT